MMAEDWAEIFQDGLDLDMLLDTIPAMDQNETRSTVKTLVMTCCYGRGKSLNEIKLPRLPSVSLVGIMPSIHLEKLISAKTRHGRGRARLLSEKREEFLELPRKMQAVQPPKTSLFDFPIQPLRRTDLDSSLVDSFDIFMSDEEDEGVHDVALPSQRGITPATHPFGRPPKPKKQYDFTSSQDFPSLDSSTPAGILDMCNSNTTTTTRSFPPLPRHLSKKVTNCDIIFKPMKDKKSKKKKKSENKANCTKQHDTAVRETARKDNSALEDTDYIDASENTCEVIAMSVTSTDTHLELSSLGESNLSLKPAEYMDTFPVDGSIAEHDISSSKCELSALELPTNNSWELIGPGVIQINGLPADGNMSSLEEIVTSFGTVVGSEHRIMPDNTKSVRFMYKNPDACDWSVSCLHDTDCVFPETHTVLECFVVE